ncbi:hypothetical protein FQN57_002737 [Myotisia sp. PD_48]|nr:hypothetical protein FQN57_002737 [Myotisia sp. PD_48]
MADFKDAPRFKTKEIPKDEIEENLEKLVFGDSVEFQDALKRRSELGTTDLVLRSESEPEDDIEEYDDEEDALAALDDADLFYIDAGPSGVAPSKPTAAVAPFDQSSAQLDNAPAAAWEDSDDERIRVSLAGNDRLRKLREAEVDDVISGRDYTSRLRKQFERLHPYPEWASLAEGPRKRRKTMDKSDGSAGSESDEEETIAAQPLARLLQNIGDLTKEDAKIDSNGKRKLRQGAVDIQRLKDIGGSQPSSIDSLSFHPHYPLLLSSGPASTIFLHHIAPQATLPNPLLTSLHIRRTPLRTSAFAPPTGNRIFCAGRRRYFHVWNLDTGRIEKVNGPHDRKHEQKSMESFKLSPCGRWIGLEGTVKKGGGVITVLDATTMQWIAQVQIDSFGGVADFAWWSNGEGLCVVGKNGEVSEWNRREKRIVARWVDEGAVGTTVLNLGGSTGRQELGGDRWVAIGSSSGIVNIYDRKPWAEAVGRNQRSAGEKADLQSGIPRNPKPTRMLDQLTTPTSHLVFSNDGQFLVMASRWKRDALRLIHLPSCTVYPNWPTSNTPFGRISSVAISPISNMLAVGNEQGKIRLWEIHG